MLRSLHNAVNGTPACLAVRWTRWQPKERIESVADDPDLEEVYDTERHLLYVACTRARDHLMVTGVEPASEFLDDFLDPSHLGTTAA